MADPIRNDHAAQEADIAGRETTSEPGKTKRSLRDHVRDNRWTWLGSLVIGLLIALAAVAVERLWPPGPDPGNSNVYVFYDDNQPAAGCLVSNGSGPGIPVDARGVFTPRESWRPGQTLMVFGPALEGEPKQFLGEHVLHARNNGEWEPIRLTLSRTEVVGAEAE